MPPEVLLFSLLYPSTFSNVILEIVLNIRGNPKLPLALSQKDDKGLVINYGEGGATKWENRGSELFAPPLKTG